MTAAATPGRARAAAALGVPPEATPAEARAAFLRRLAVENFVPPEECTAATNALASTALPVGPEEAERDAREDVETFAGEFWSLPPTARRARWAELWSQYPHGPAAARLRGLAPGLDVAVTPRANPEAEALAACVREWFVLPPRKRAVRRAGWRAEQAARFPALVRAALVVLREDMPLARLDPGLFNAFPAGQRFEPVPADPTAEPGTVSVVGDPGGFSVVAGSRPFQDLSDELRTNVEVTVGTAQPPQPQERGCWGPGCVTWVVLWIMFALFRGAYHSSPTTTKSTQPYTIPTYRQSAPTMNQSAPSQFTPEQIKAFQEYERNPVGPMPHPYPLYQAWKNQFAPPGVSGAGSSGTAPTNRR